MHTASSDTSPSARIADRSAVPIKCLKCEAPLRSPIVCEGCHSLFPLPHSADYFDLLGLPRRFAVDEKRLNTVFRALARSIHPDRFGGESEEVRALATRLSAEINQAQATLSDPVRRADYLLELSGGPSAVDLREVPGGLLAEVMTLREELEEARAAGDHAALENRRQTIAERRHDTLTRIAAIAERLGSATDDDKRMLRRLLNSMRYFDNLLAELAADPLAAR